MYFFLNENGISIIKTLQEYMIDLNNETAETQQIESVTNYRYTLCSFLVIKITDKDKELLSLLFF